MSFTNHRQLPTKDANGNTEVALITQSVDAAGAVVGPGGSGSSSGTGGTSTAVATDGDLRTIDTVPEATSTDPTANDPATGNSSTPYSSNFLLRWLVKLSQLVTALTAGGVAVLKVGGVYLATLPTLTNGQRTELYTSDRGVLLVDTTDIASAAVDITQPDSGGNSTTTSQPGFNGQLLYQGTPRTNSFARIKCSGNSSFSLQVLNQPFDTPFTGTLAFRRSLDNGVTWTAVGAFTGGSADVPQSITAQGAFHGNCSSATDLMVVAQPGFSGTARVILLAGQGTGTVTVGNPVSIYDRVTRLLFKITNLLALPTDNALVVANRDFGNLTEVAFTLTRPADTTAYNANDAIANSTTQGSVVNPSFANAARANGGSGYITAAFCQVLGSTFNTPLRLHLFKAAPSAIADNAPYTTLDANNPNYIGHIDFSGFTSGGTGSTTARATGVFPTGNALAFICATGSSTIFGMVETRGAFTPTASQTIRFQFAIDRY